MDPNQADILTANLHVERLVMRGRAMDGWLRSDVPPGETDDDLAR